MRKVRAHRPDVAVIDIRMPPDAHRRGPAGGARDPRRSCPGRRRARALPVRRGALRGAAARRRRRGRRLPAQGPRRRRRPRSSTRSAAWPTAAPRSTPRSSSHMLAGRSARRPARRAHAARARGARADGRGAVQRAIARPARRHRARGRAARHRASSRSSACRPTAGTTAACSRCCSTCRAAAVLDGRVPGGESRPHGRHRRRAAPLLRPAAPARPDLPAGHARRPPERDPARVREVGQRDRPALPLPRGSRRAEEGGARQLRASGRGCRSGSTSRRSTTRRTPRCGSRFAGRRLVVLHRPRGARPAGDPADDELRLGPDRRPTAARPRCTRSATRWGSRTSTRTRSRGSSGTSRRSTTSSPGRRTSGRATRRSTTCCASSAGPRSRAPSGTRTRSWSTTSRPG